MESDSKIDKWNKWLEVIWNDLSELLMLRNVYLELGKIVNTNPKIQTENYFYEWLRIVYHKTACVGVRRQVDKDRSVINLRRLLTEIQQDHTLLTLSRFEDIYTRAITVVVLLSRKRTMIFTKNELK